MTVALTTVFVLYRAGGCSSGGFGAFLPLWGNCLVVSVIARPVWPSSGPSGDVWVIFGPSLPLPGRFCQFLAISVHSGGFLASARSKTA